MTEASEAAAYVRLAADKADSAKALTINVGLDVFQAIGSLDVLIREIVTIEQKTRSILATVKESLQAAYQALSGTANYPVILAVGWLERSESDLENDLQKLAELKESLIRVQMIPNEIRTDFEEIARFTGGAAANFRGAAEKL